ncbi:hypothetical protein AB0J90_08375 [Micromonospora sp. NPDC049523]|uniref:hypothetical protein n=1 Tax=Micromonospora sp. NPDC049523 TaxID=3155921 RepID=UPI003423C45F
MNSHLSGALRNAFEELAETAPPPAGLAPAALVAARRQRITRRIASGGTAVAVCAALIGVIAAVAPTSTTDGTDRSASDTMRPNVVTAYTGIRDANVTDPSPHFFYSLLLDYSTGRYERVAYPYVKPSPDGRRVLVTTYDDSATPPMRTGLMDRASGDVRWISDATIGSSLAENPWSPDGRWILLIDIQGERGFGLLDPETLKITYVPLPDVASQPEQRLNLVWTPDGNGVAMMFTQVADQPEDTVTGIRFYDLTGRVVRTVSTGPGAYPFLPTLSPGGGGIALRTRSSPQEPFVITVVDSTTGAVRHTVTAPPGGSLLGWADEEHLLFQVVDSDQGPAQPSAATTAGATQSRQLVVVDLDGRVDHSVTLSAVDSHQYFQRLFIGPSTGLPPTAAPITF